MIVFNKKSTLAFLCFLLQCNQMEINKPDLFQFLFLFSSPTSVGVITTDFGSGGRFKSFDPNSLTPSPTSALIHSDAIGRFFNNKVYIINRLNRDTIQVLDPNLAYLTVQDFSVGQGKNPQDISVWNNKYYVALYNADYIPIYNASTGIQQSFISLSAYKESFSSSGTPDAFVEIGAMVQHESSLFVTLQRLDRNDVSGFFPPNSDSLLIEIDMNLDQVIGVYTLPIRNPSGRIYKKVIFGDLYLLISCVGYVGFLSRADGGILAFHLPTKTFRANALFAESTAGGDILNFQIKDESIGYASVLDASFKKTIQAFRPATGERLGTLLEIPGTTGVSLNGMALTMDGKLIIGVTDFKNPGLNVYDTNQGNVLLSPTPISVDLTPLDIFQLQNSD
ncbi:hypothetical protein EHQ58_09340 [Leptospira ognonensis]|uniref:Uncharacterized protein n=1 Tax=Leptospira ognonensis TaxID=2484945 RepID=A0A4R9K2M5_9LEPT|nr:hypothetical protein [Leptospira ognonensis]TGL59110.1 hypothetical protein EHQ58_09340 [Leptospira ognonensis]